MSPIAVKAGLTSADIDAHARLRIEADLLVQQQVRRVDDHEAREVLGLNGRPGRLDGILYPYIMPGESRAVTHRLRRDHPDIENGATKNKYLSGYSDRRRLYFATNDVSLLHDPDVLAVLVEAEKAALSITSAGQRLGRSVLAIGCGGCYGWRGRIGKTVDPNGARVDEMGVLPDFDRVEWAGRDVVLAFDANASTNPKVQAGRRGLAAELTKRGAKVRILELPADGGVNGPDDYIGRHGDDAFFALVDAAADARTHDAIFRLNQKHAVVREAGKTVVITEDHDPVLNRAHMTRSSFADFRNFYLRESVQVGVDTKTGAPICKPLGHVWLCHPDRRQYEGIGMNPAGDMPGYLNLWRGFAVQPQAGNWKRFRDHIFEVICASNVVLFDYVLAWMAFGVQHPDRPPEVAIAMRGPRGTGKGAFARTYGGLFGQHFLQIANTKHLTGHFNSHLRDAVVLFADEAFWAGDKQGESVLKMLVTEPVIPIERKGQDVVVAKNMLHILLASNNDWVVPAGVDERRFCVLDVDASRQQDHEYFAALAAEMQNGGAAAMLHDLLQLDLSKVNLRAVPQTEALRQQKVLSLQPNERWLYDKLMTGRWLHEHEGWETFVLKERLHEDYVQTLQKAGIDRRSTETELGMFIKKVFPEAREERRRMGAKRQRGWAVSNLPTCRLAFDTLTHSSHPWPDDSEGA